jgi:hypothetical protein
VRVMQILFVLLVSLLVFIPAKAEGRDVVNGRYNGDVLVFKLTNTQKKVIEHFRTCHMEHFKTMNVYTPYVFALTPSQARKIKAIKGFSPRYFEAFEIYRGDNDAGPFWNVALRFSEDEIEIPLGLLLNDKDAKEEFEIQGWQPHNPCFPRIKNN